MNTEQHTRRPSAEQRPASMYYISRIFLRNIKCIPGPVEFHLPFPSANSPSWTLLLGNNGTGKTTLMRVVAMCLCDATRASGLLTELPGEIIRDGCRDATVALTLDSAEKQSAQYTITTTFQRTDTGSEHLTQEVSPTDDFPRNELFACGYGAGLRAIGNEDVGNYRLIDAVYSLFNYHAPFQNPEFVLLRIAQHTGTKIEHLLPQIDRVLMLDPGSTKWSFSGLRIDGPWGTYVTARGLGDGYTATLAWICDLLGWYFIATRGESNGHVRGVVLLDEMEQHLHPLWQREMIGLLSKEFPHVQFIASTHAPLTVIGSAALRDECCQLVLFEHTTDGVQIKGGLRPPRGRRADQVLTSYLFGLPWTTSDDVVKKIEQYDQLQRRLMRTKDGEVPVAAEDIQRMRDLRKTLEESLGSAETPLQQLVEKAVLDTLHSMESQQRFESDAAKLEARRQLQQLFGER